MWTRRTLRRTLEPGRRYRRISNVSKKWTAVFFRFGFGFGAGVANVGAMNEAHEVGYVENSRTGLISCIGCSCGWRGTDTHDEAQLDAEIDAHLNRTNLRDGESSPGELPRALAVAFDLDHILNH